LSSLKSDCLANWLKVCYYFAIISTVNSSFSTNQPTNQSFIQRRKNIVIIRFDDDYSSFASVPSVILYTVNRIRYEIVQISSYYIPSFFSYVHHYVCNITRCMIKSLDYYSLPEYTVTTCWIRLDIERSRGIITCAFFNVWVLCTHQPHTFWIINNVPLFI
jgi:hypothetical protein